MQRHQTRRLTIQEEIASNMMEDYGSNLGQDPNAGPVSMPSDAPGGAEVIDAVGDERHTEMRECSAIDCANNLRGRSCGLAAIQVDRRGACGSYESRGASRYEDDEVGPDEDEETIIGISTMMPTQVDLPSQRGKMTGGFGNFNNGTPF